MSEKNYQNIIVGAGLAGCELAYQLAPQQPTLLVSQALDNLANLYGDTVSPEFFPADSFLHSVASQLPNTALWAFHRAVKEELERRQGLHLLQSTVTGQQTHANGVNVQTWEGIELQGQRLILAVGAFLRGRLSFGAGANLGTTEPEQAGRLSEVAYDFLADSLAEQFQLLPQQQNTEASAEPYSVSFVCFSDSVAGNSDSSGQHRHSYSVLDADSKLYAIGRCTSGLKSYASVVAEAQQLAGFLLTNTS